MNRHHVAPDGRPMLTGRVGVVMGLAPRRVLAVAPPRHPRTAAPTPPRTTRTATASANGADAAFAAALAGLLKPKPDPWAELIKNLLAPRP